MRRTKSTHEVQWLLFLVPPSNQFLPLYGTSVIQKREQVGSFMYANLHGSIPGTTTTLQRIQWTYLFAQTAGCRNGLRNGPCVCFVEPLSTIVRYHRYKRYWMADRSWYLLVIRRMSRSNGSITLPFSTILLSSVTCRTLSTEVCPPRHPAT